MAVEDTHEVIESILVEEDLTRIQEDITIPMLVRLKLPGPSERMTMGLVTEWHCMKMHSRLD